MVPQTFLVIDDEPQIRQAVRHAFESDGVRVIEASTGTDGMALAAAERPDLIILDLGLPDVVGLEVCREIRSWTSAPILVLSARHSDAEKVALLDAGADDYVTKPFSTPELQARGRALVRRVPAKKSSGDRLEIGQLVMDLRARTLSRQEVPIHLTPIEWDLLRVLMANSGRTLTHQQLFSQVWSGRAFGDAQQYLRVYVAHLRRKIGDDPLVPRYISTDPGVGYRFSADAELSAGP